MSFLSSIDIAGSGLTAQKKRLDVITENIVNRETTRTDEGGPYRRKLVVFREINGSRQFRPMLDFQSERLRNLAYGRAGTGDKGVMVESVFEDPSDFIPVYDPNHPDANEEGYVMMPNVNNTTEMIDAMAATRSYSANIAAFEAIKNMTNSAMQIGR